MKHIRKLIATILTVITIMSCFAVSISAANITVGLLSEIRATQTADTITLSWDKAENAKGYRIYKNVDGKWKAIKTTTAKEYTITNLEAKTSYTFAVKPYTKLNGETVWAKKHATIDTYTAGFVGNLTKINAEQTADSVTLFWEKAPGAKGYRIYKRVDGKWKAIKTTTANKYTITNLEAKTSYTFAVKPYTKLNGETVWAKKYIKIDTNTAGFVGNLTKINAEQTANSVTLSWEKTQGAKGYRVFEIVNGKWKALKTTTALKYSISGLDYGTNHTYAVRPYTKDGSKVVWAKKYATVTVNVEIPQVTGVKGTATTNSVKLTWNKIGDSVTYVVFSYNSATGEYTQLKKTSNTSYTVSNLAQNKTYKYAVQAYKTIDKTNYWGKVSSIVTVTTNEQEYFIGVNGEKVYTDTDGTQYYIDEYGRKIIYNPNSSEESGDYDGSYCIVCGKTDCKRIWADYYCKICKKTIYELECHPKTHYEASK